MLSRYADLAALLVKHSRTDLGKTARGGLDALTESAELDTTSEEEKADAEAFAADLERMGPTFIKLGQLLSTRADVLPDSYLDALARLQDDCEPIPWDDVVATIQDELGVRVSDAFQEIDLTPIAAASLGQVHKAVLRSGATVAVKVQRPGLVEQVTTDLEAIARMAEFADKHTATGRKFGMAPMVEEFSRSMLGELDYRREADNLRQLGQNLEGIDEIVVPQPVNDYCSQRVLTMSFVHGRKVTSLTGFSRLEIDGAPLADALFRAYLHQIFEDGFFHADPHPGNVLVTDDHRLALIDLGMVARLDRETQDQLVSLLLALSEADGPRAADVCINLGEQLEDFDRDTLVREVSHLIADNARTSVGELAFGHIVSELSRISGANGLRPPPELTMLGKALLNLDEIARALDPDFRPDQAIERHSAELLRHRMLDDLSPANLFAAAMDAKEFAAKLPSRVNQVMDALAEGQLTLNIQGVDEESIISGIRKVGNRITAGLVTAALIVGAALLMRVETKQTLLGYPALAIILFLMAATLGTAIVVMMLVDRD